MEETSFAGPRAGPSAQDGAFSEPAGPDVRLPVPAGVGLDVEDGRPVDKIEARDLEDAAVPGQEPEDAHPERIRAVGRPGGEDAAGLRLARRHDLELGGPGFVEMEEDDDMGEPFEAVEAGGEFGEDLDPADRALEEPGRREGRRGQVGRLFETRPDDADGTEPDAGRYFPM